MEGQNQYCNLIPERIRTNSHSTEFRLLTGKLDAALKQLYGTTQSAFDRYNEIENLDTVVLAYWNGMPAGCGCFKPFDEGRVELKRMYVEPEFRRLGIAQAVLHELEDWARELGYAAMVLETGTLQPQAISLYSTEGYQIIPNFDPYSGNELSICMEKRFAAGC